MTTFDRYLLSRFLHAFAVLFVSTFGLFVVFDAFTNVDVFQQQNDGALAVFANMAGYYVYRSSIFFEMTGAILAVISVMVVFALLHRHNEIHPLLAAGIPTYRLIVPLIVGAALVNGALIANQEWIVPHISHQLQVDRNGRSEACYVEPVYDRSLIHISGEQLLLDEHRLIGSQFLLPAPGVATELTTLKADEAVFFKKTANRPGGWLLRGVTPNLADVRLTPDGRKIVVPARRPNDVFIISDISSDQLYNRSTNYMHVSTPDLIRRINDSSAGLVSVRAQSLHLHERLTRPIVSLFAILVAVPLVVRRESTGLVANLALCTGALSLVFGATQLFHYVGGANLLASDLAAWGPVILGGSLGAWLSGVMQT